VELAHVQAVLAAHRAELTELGVRSLYVFGSTARGEAGPDSDVDLLVDLDPSKRISLLGFAHIKGEIEDMLGCAVDLVEAHVLRDQWRDRVLGEAVRAA